MTLAGRIENEPMQIEARQPGEDEPLDGAEVGERTLALYRGDCFG